LHFLFIRSYYIIHKIRNMASRGILELWNLLISRYTFKVMNFLNWEVDPMSKVTGAWFAVESPTFVISSILIYLSIVISSCFFNKNSYEKRKLEDPFSVRILVIFHNLFLVILSLYMCIGCIIEAKRNSFKIWGNAYDPKQVQLAHYIYLFYVSKIYEFLDTLIMIIKKNFKQVSFLHVYHHVTISFIWWMIARRAPGGDAYFSAALNSWVHVCMYSYYLLAILVGKSEKARKKYLWWGRYLTQMQMLQFVCNLFQALYCRIYSPYPTFISDLLLLYMLSLLVLFGRFYYSKHIVPSKKISKLL
jgi:elongation of very long chain fatty acids protein 4